MRSLILVSEAKGGADVKQKQDNLTVWGRYKHNKKAMAALIILVVELLALFVLPLVMDLDPAALSGDGNWLAPCKEHLLGTDSLGRDSLARLIYGGRTSMIVGLCSLLINVVLGLIMGLLAGYFRGIWETIVMRLADIFMSFPTMILALTVEAVVGASMHTVIAIIGVLGWPGIAKLIYGNIISVREKEYVESSRALGAGHLLIISRDILPNTLTPLWMTLAFRLSQAILTESSLSFLGAGIKAPQASWGNILYEAQNLTVLTFRPWFWLPPGICIVITVVCINLIGEGLRKAMDTKAQ